MILHNKCSFIVLSLVNLDDIVENPFDIDDQQGQCVLVLRRMTATLPGTLRP